METEFQSKRITVMGLGRFGGGLGVTRWLASQGAHVLVTDLDSAEKLHEPVSQLQDLIQSRLVSLRLGEHRESDFTDCDIVIANPAVPRPWNNQFINAAITAGIPVTTEIRLLTERLNRNRVIGITGSAGKSTTTAMIHHLLVKAGIRAHLGGNIGGSLLNQLDEIEPDDWIVLELSSAMLHWLGEGVGYARAPGWSPHIAVLTNIAPNHVDWHGSVDHYMQSKLNCVKWQHDHSDDLAILRTCDLIDPHMPRSPNHHMINGPVPSIALKIPGRHNQMNAQLAIRTVALATGLEERDAASLLADFSGLPHRLQLVAERDGLRFYNDSKSTTPEATALAVDAFEDPSRIHLIAGGYDKGSDLSSIGMLASRIAGLYTIGKTGPTILAAAPSHSMAIGCETLATAVEAALARMKCGDILLLSPGCASWDQFINFEERGHAFTELVTAKLGSQITCASNVTWSR